MAWRFTASKFKNTTPKIPKKENDRRTADSANYSRTVDIKLKVNVDTVFDLPIGNVSCTNNGIQVGSEFMAFLVEGEGGKLGALPLGAKGRRTRSDIQIIAAHSEQVSDFNFMTYAEDYLATCSRDEAVKIWKLTRDSSPQLATQIDVGGGVPIECLKAHSTAANIIALGSYGTAYVTDVSTQKVALQVHGITDKAQSLDWSEDGRLLAVAADKGRQVVVYDPRAGSDPIQSLEAHGGMGREARVLFAGDRLISTGFTNKRVQEVRLFDTTKWGSPIHTQEFVSTTGVLIPHYDPDTRLVFLSGKGTNKLFMLEIQDRQPYMSSVFELTLPEQTIGAALGSKRKVSVMDGEVDTYYQLTKSTILPTPCIVPRRSYRDFHADLYPETRSGEAGCNAYEWLAGNNTQPSKISMAPSSSNSPPPQEPTPPVVKQQSSVGGGAKPMGVSTTHQNGTGAATTTKSQVENKVKPVINPKDEVKELDYGKENGARASSNYQTAAVPPSGLRAAKEIEKASLMPEEVHTPNPPTTGSTQGATSPYQASTSPPETIISPSPASCSASTPSVVGPAYGEKITKDDASTSGGAVSFRKIGSSNRTLSQRVRPKSCVVGQITSKFRHVETLAGVKAGGAFTALRNINTRLPPESNGAVCSGKFIAVPLTGPAGLIDIFDVNHPEKVKEGRELHGIYNKAQITDFQWNPFDDEHLAVGTDIGQINFWRLKVDDGDRREKQPEKTLKICGEKIVCMRWHPLAKNLMAIALSNSTIEIWDVEEEKIYHRFTNHSGGILAIAWSAGGRRLASVGKDSMLYVHMPAFPEAKAYERKVLESTRAARVLFACDDRIIIVVGMTKSSQRQIQMYDAGTVDLRPIYTQTVDSATQPLIPHYDYDTNVLFVSAKGERYINMFEVIYDSPYLLPLAPYLSTEVGQAMAYHNKKKCNVMAVEFQVAWRLTEKSLEQIVFRVPRVKKDVFQDDLFPDSLITWEPVCTAAEWMSGLEVPPIFRSLKPEGVFSSIPRPIGTSARHSEVPSSAATTSTAAHSTFPSEEPTPVPRNPHGCAVESSAAPDRQQVAAAWSTRINVDTRLEQDNMEGVDESEWK